MSVVKSGKGVVLPEMDNAYEISEACRLAASRGQTIGDGKPKVEAVEDILGYDIDAEQRDAIWEALQ